MNSVVYLSLISSAAAFFSGAIAFLYKPSIDERDGRKRLTPVGRFAFAFFVISSVSAFASAILGSWEAESSKVATRISAEEETRWRARSERLEAAILNNTRVALKESEEVTKRMFSEFSHQQ